MDEGSAVQIVRSPVTGFLNLLRVSLQRTELEQFFLDSLEHVKNEIVTNR